MIGTIQRTMRFQSFDTLIGITGWMFRTFWVRSDGPMLKLKLSWIGTLTRLAIGFCAGFLNASLFVAAAVVSCVATSAPTGPTVVSCADRGPDNNSKHPSEPKARTELFTHCMKASSSITHVTQTRFRCPRDEAWRPDTPVESDPRIVPHLSTGR